MIGHYLSSNNEMCYSTKIQTFPRTKQGLKFHTRKKSFFASVGCSAAFAMATRLGNNGSCTRRHYRGSQDPFNFRRVRLDRPIIRDPQQLLPVWLAAMSMTLIPTDQEAGSCLLTRQQLTRLAVCARARWYVPPAPFAMSAWSICAPVVGRNERNACAFGMAIYPT